MTTTENDPRSHRAGLDRGDERQPARGRALWVVFGSLLLLAALWWGTFNVVELLAHEQRTERFTVPAAELTRLFVDNDSGSVRSSAPTPTRSASRRRSPTVCATPASAMSVVDSTLELHGTCPIVGSMWCRVTYRIEVPRGLDVEVNTDNDRVDVRNIDGDVDRLRQWRDRAHRRLRHDRRPRRQRTHRRHATCPARSSTSAPTTAASSWTFTEPPDRVTANGDNGSIEIVVPQIDEGYNVIADTANGGATSLSTTTPSRRTRSPRDGQRVDHRSLRV